MRHIVIRLAVGIIWLVAAAVSCVQTILSTRLRSVPLPAFYPLYSVSLTVLTICR